VNGRSNHIVAGLVFVGVCILIAVVAFVVLRPSPGSAADEEDQQINTMVADLAPVEDTVPDAAAPVDSESQQLTTDGPINPQIGACHMGECSWSVEKARETIKEESTGRLIKVTLLGGTSHYAGNDYPQRYVRSERISWNEAPHDVYAFCSKTLPAVMLQDGDSWQTDIIDFVNGPPGVLQGSAAMYVQVCHGAATAYPDDDFAARYGYVAAPPEIEDPAISTPSDIFALAQRVAAAG
jgi:hypothetical protein